MKMKKYVKKKVCFQKSHAKVPHVDVIGTNNTCNMIDVNQRKVNIGLHLCSTDDNNTTQSSIAKTSKVTSKFQYLKNMVNTKLRPCVKKRKSVDKNVLMNVGCAPSPSKQKIPYIMGKNNKLINNNNTNRLAYSSSMRNSKLCKTPVKLHSKSNAHEIFSQSFSIQNIEKSPHLNGDFSTQYDNTDRCGSPFKIGDIQHLHNNDDISAQNIIKAIQSNYNLSKDFVLTSEGLKKIVFPANVISTYNLDNQQQYTENKDNSITSSRPNSSQSLSNSNTQHLRQYSDSCCSYNIRQQITLTSEDEATLGSFNKQRRHSLQTQPITGCHPNEIRAYNFNQNSIGDDNIMDFCYSNQTANMNSTFYNPNKSSILCYGSRAFDDDQKSDDNMNGITTKLRDRSSASQSNTPLSNVSFTTNIPESFTHNVKSCYSVEAWDNMINSECLYASRSYYIKKQKYVSAKTRAILFGWLTEVCDAFKMHRETYYLAINYVDRYLSVVNDIRCNQLQLLGVTSLYVAAKLEEIYPPNLHRFVNVTDGATSIDQILTQELALVKVLKWQLNEMTVYSWLAVFVLAYENHQLLQHSVFNRRTHPKTRGHERRITSRCLWQIRCFEIPTNTFKEIVNITKLLEIIILDAESLKYSSIILAASVFFIINNYDQSILNFTGLDFMQVDDCIKWMDIYSNAIRPKRPIQSIVNTSQLLSTSTSSQNTSVNSFDMLCAVNDENYNIQKHRDAIKYLDSCQERTKLEKSIPIDNNVVVDRCYR